MEARRRLPGIVFDELTPSAPETLPRMDIALFVGFAERGPAHRPVRLADAAEFGRVFGGDVALARDGEGRMATAALGPAVRAFFSNGGRECWAVRVARTAALEARWRGIPEAQAATKPGVASHGRFRLPGVVELAPDGALRPAFARAASLGAWPDRMSARVRGERRSIPATAIVAAGKTIAFASPAPLAVGDLIEIVTGEVTAYAAVTGTNGASILATWLAAFAPPPAGAGEIAGEVDTPGGPVKAMLNMADGALRIEGDPGEGAGAGHFIAVSVGARRLLFLIGSSSSDSLSGTFRELVAPPAPAADARIERVAIGLRTELAGAPEAVLADIGLTPQAGASWWSRRGDDERAPDALAAPAFLAAEPGVPPIAWLPFGLGQLFSDRFGALPDTRTALERDGLSRFDEELFLDPELAGVSAHRLREEAERILHIDERPLFGIHAALATGGSAYNPVTLLSAPDASHAGWEARAGMKLPAVPAAQDAPPADWFDHRGPCAQGAAGTGRAAGPDRSRFLDCSVQALPAPHFLPLPPERAPGAVLIAWAGGPPGATYRLEAAARPDFKGAQLVYEGLADEFPADARTEGFYYYRLTARLGEDSSAAAVAGFAVRDTGWAALGAEAYDRRPLLAVQRGLIRLAAAAGDMFALLSLPRHYRAEEAAAYSAELTLLRDGGADGALLPMERRALSFAALHHPWIAGRRGEGQALLETPPEGAVAGIHARRTLSRGAWIAAANEEVRDVVALSPGLGARDLEILDEARINAIAKKAEGFRLLDALTLSTEPDWGQANVRRLISLLRRAAVRRGASYVFEPNGEVLRRAVERGFTHLLDHMLRLGAFAGRTADDSFRIAVQPTSADRDGGRFVAEIAVAPSQPMRFLTVRLAQTGERFTIAEER